MDDDETRGFTPSNLLGCAVGAIIFLVAGMMLVVGVGMGCQPGHPCMDTIARGFLLSLAVALLLGLFGGWGAAKLYRWVARRFGR